jgi:hypothetical protein
MPVDTGNGKIFFNRPSLPKKTKLKKSVTLDRVELHQVLIAYFKSIANVDDSDDISIDIKIVSSYGACSKPMASIKSVTISN